MTLSRPLTFAVALLFLCSPEVPQVEALPRDVIAQTQRRGISLRSGVLKIGPQHRKVFFHLYVVPQRKPSLRSKSIKREDVVPGSSIPDSPFYLDLFLPENGKMQKVSSARFIEDGDVNRVEIRWLQPQRRRGPVILLRFGVGDEGEWWLVVFAKGIRAKPVLQRVSFSSGRDSSCVSRFDRVDSRGFMIIQEECEWFEKGTHKTREYHWNGTRFK